MKSVFTRIIEGEFPCYKIAEDENYFAFLDINPLTKGHTLVVPKIQIDKISDLDDQTLSGLILFAKKISKAVEKTILCKRVGMVVLGMEVPHAHIHLIPLNKEADVNFTNPKLKVEPIEMQDIANKIKANLS